MFMIDIETLGVESTCVVLSAAIVYFDPEEEQNFDDLVNKALVVKFDAKDQINTFNRTITKSTLEWWNRQSDKVRKISFDPNAEVEISVREGLEQIRGYMAQFPNHDKSTVWARGSLDQLAIDSLARAAKTDPIAPFWVWRDVRTAIDCLTGSTTGYAAVANEGFVLDNVVKHNPAHDCAYDVMMLLYGK